MWILGHVTTALLTLDTDDEKPSANPREELWVLLGVIAPDLVDKPLGSIKILPAYHTVGHSVLTATCLWAISVTTESEGRFEHFCRGWTLHLAGDLPLAFSRWDDPEFFFWPVLRPTNDVDQSLSTYISEYMRSPWFLLEMLLCVAVWYRR